MRRSLFLFFLLLSMASASFAQSYHCEITNINQPNATTIDFDVYLYKTTSDTLYLGAFQGGINFNYAGLANGGTITGSFLPNSSYDPSSNSQLPAPQNAPNWVINPTSLQIRMLAAIQTSQLVAVKIPNGAPGIKLGTFRMINTVPFSSCTKPNFEWSFVTGSNITRTGVTCWVNSAATQTSLTTQTTFNYNSQGPEHFVESNPSINPTTVTTSFTILACNSFTWQGNTYTTSGVYTDTLVAANGCDSILELNLTIDTPTTTTYNQQSCNSYVWPINGQTYTTSGVYIFNTLQPSGCIHTDVLNLTINSSTTGNSTQFACDGYTWAQNGITYYNSGNYSSIGTNAAGCPDTQFLALTLGYTNFTYDTIYNCNPIVWNGQNLNATGNYQFNTLNASGCDSTTYLYFELLTTYIDSQTVHSCGPYTVGTTVYTAPGTYFYQTTNAFGCIIDHVLMLTIGQDTYNSTTVTSCGSLYYNNTLFSSSGLFTTIMPNASGCDSIITLSVTINPIYTTAQFITTCDSYSLLGTTYTASGIYYDTVQTVNGCDSIIKLTLTIKKSSSSYINQTAVNSYTWAVNGLTYSNTGIYTYISTNAAGCSQYDTLNLTIDFPTMLNNSNDLLQELALFPNPNTGKFQVRFDSPQTHDAQVQIMDLSGRVVQQATMAIQAGKNEWDFDLSSLADGMYQFNLMVDKQQTALKYKVVKSSH